MRIAAIKTGQFLRQSDDLEKLHVVLAVYEPTKGRADELRGLQLGWPANEHPEKAWIYLFQVEPGGMISDPWLAPVWEESLHLYTLDNRPPIIHIRAIEGYAEFIGE
jgi:hypothetical protein